MTQIQKILYKKNTSEQKVLKKVHSLKVSFQQTIIDWKLTINLLDTFPFSFAGFILSN